MTQDLVSMTITDEQKATALAAINTLEANLVGLVSLEPNDRKSLIRMGLKSDGFARGTIRLLESNAGLVPPDMDLPGAVVDLDTLDKLLPVAEAMNRLNRRMQDTVAALGHDIMSRALDGYGMLKVLGDAQGLDELRKGLGARFAKTRRVRPAEEAREVVTSED